MAKLERWQKRSNSPNAKTRQPSLLDVIFPLEMIFDVSERLGDLFRKLYVFV